MEVKISRVQNGFILESLGTQYIFTQFDEAIAFVIAEFKDIV
jgi:hypothetical protein